MTTALQQMIEAQPAALDTIAALDVTAAADTLAGARRIWLIGTGTSHHAAELGAIALSALGHDARAASAVDFARRAGRLLRPGDAAILITHTARTAYARRSRSLLLDAAVPLISVTGPAADWPEALRTPVTELSETYTVSYTAALAVLAQIAGQLGAPDSGPEAVRAVSELVRAVLATPGIDGVPRPERAMAIVGAGDLSVTAREGALKIREGARILCEGFDPERLLHGAAVPYGTDDTLLVLRPDTDPDGLTGALAQAAAAEGVLVKVLDDQTTAAAPLLDQIPITVRLQLLAARFATERGQDPDVAIVGAWAAPRLWESGA